MSMLHAVTLLWSDDQMMCALCCTALLKFDSTFSTWWVSACGTPIFVAPLYSNSIQLSLLGECQLVEHPSLLHRFTQIQFNFLYLVSVSLWNTHLCCTALLKFDSTFSTWWVSACGTPIFAAPLYSNSIQLSLLGECQLVEHPSLLRRFTQIRFNFLYLVSVSLWNTHLCCTALLKFDSTFSTWWVSACGTPIFAAPLYSNSIQLSLLGECQLVEHPSLLHRFIQIRFNFLYLASVSLWNTHLCCTALLKFDSTFSTWWVSACGTPM